MIPQVASAVGQSLSGQTQPAPLVEVKQQKSAAPVELPQKAVKPVESADINTVKAAAEQINKLVHQFDRNLEFMVDDDTGANIVRVIDSRTQDIIRQMPTEEMLAIAKALDKLQGMLIREKA